MPIPTKQNKRPLKNCAWLCQACSTVLIGDIPPKEVCPLTSDLSVRSALSSYAFRAILVFDRPLECLQ